MSLVRQKHQSSFGTESELVVQSEASNTNPNVDLFVVNEVGAFGQFLHYHSVLALALPDYSADLEEKYYYHYL